MRASVSLGSVDATIPPWAVVVSPSCVVRSPEASSMAACTVVAAIVPAGVKVMLLAGCWAGADLSASTVWLAGVTADDTTCDPREPAK